MTTLLGKNTSLDHGGGRSALARIFHSVRDDLDAVEEHLAAVLRATTDQTAREIVDFLLESPAKRIRPALVLLSARTVHATGAGAGSLNNAVIDVAAAVELIHMASLVHDDLIDGATVRHHRASIHAKWGKRVAVSVGDHLCAQAFRLVADCADPRLFAILGAQMVAMCEGELQQVVRRGDFSLCEHHCLAMIEKKTASLFQACCGAGAVAAGGVGADNYSPVRALEEFGFHLGIAFQLLDDCRDLLSDREKLGKSPGQDLRAGDVTLPLLYAMGNGGAVGTPSAQGRRQLARVGEAFRSSQAPQRIAELVESCVERARQELRPLVDSDFKMSLRLLAEHIAASVSGVLVR